MESKRMIIFSAGINTSKEWEVTRKRVCNSSTRNKIVFKNLHNFEKGAGKRPIWQCSSDPETVQLKYTCYVLMETKIEINLVTALHHAMNAVILEIVVWIRYDYNCGC